ncbi:MAG: hypothetical protein KKA19_07585 [Candidatus Margulisbacteria bacterium]|nr:hypothetical protein [Candidatus Margulisiibacteriota bacterium]
MRKYFILIQILIATLLFTVQAQAVDTTAAFTQQGTGARPLALAGAYTALANDANGTYWNPAGIAFARTSQFQGTSTRLFEVDYFSGNFLLKTDPAAWQLSYLRASIQGLERTVLDENNDPVETGDTFGYSGAQAMLTGGFKFSPNISCGLTYKNIEEKIDNFSGSGQAFDLGFLYYSNDRKVSIGLAGQNLGKAQLKWNTDAGTIEALPQIGRLGIAYRIFDRLLISIDGIARGERPMESAGGAELYLLRTISEHENSTTTNIPAALIFRGGASRQMSSLGLGIEFDGLVIDYAQANFTEPLLAEDVIQRVSLGFMF